VAACDVCRAAAETLKPRPGGVGCFGLPTRRRSLIRLATNHTSPMRRNATDVIQRGATLKGGKLKDIARGRRLSYPRARFVQRSTSCPRRRDGGPPAPPCVPADPTGRGIEVPRPLLLLSLTRGSPGAAAGRAGVSGRRRSGCPGRRRLMAASAFRSEAVLMRTARREVRPPIRVASVNIDSGRGPGPQVVRQRPWGLKKPAKWRQKSAQLHPPNRTYFNGSIHSRG